MDFSWHPDPNDPPYVYHFGTKWPWVRTGGVEYRTPTAHEHKYIDDAALDTLSNPANWHVPDWIDPNSIDWTWIPNPADPPYVYEFPVEWGWNNIGGPEYRVPGAREKKYDMAFVAKTQPDPKKFEIYDTISNNDKVLRWRPNPTDAPYVYVFGNQWWPAERRASVVYRAPGAQEIKYMDEPRAQRLAVDDGWTVLRSCDFDFSWEPDPGDPPYIYVFGNQHWPPEIMPTIEYHVPDAKERKFMAEPKARLLPTVEQWQTVSEVPFEFDRSWCPDPGDPPYIYVFGNQWHGPEIMPTIEYHVPDAVERKYINDPKATLLAQPERWTIPEELDAGSIDLSWHPDPGAPPYHYHFGTQYQESVGLIYTVPGATAIAFAGDIPKKHAADSPVSVLEIFYLDYSNAAAAQRFAALQERHPHVQRVRYVNSITDTIRRCVAKAKGSKFWVITSRNDYSEFDFAWHANPWQTSMTHVFGTKWHPWSDTFLINRYEFERHDRWAKGIEQFPNLNFVDNQLVDSPADSTDVYVVDHGNRELADCVSIIQGQCRVVKRTRFFDSYFETIRRVINDDALDQEYIWIVGSVCDYSRFDFSWQPDAWQRNMLHVFASDEQQFGDTFYCHVPTLREHMTGAYQLEDCATNFVDVAVPRYPLPVLHHGHDTHVQALDELKWPGPLALVSNLAASVAECPTVSLWSKKTRTVVPLTQGASTIIMPKDAITALHTQLYDYAYIDKSHALDKEPPLDVFFLDNGEISADLNWQRLLSSVGRAGLQARRVSGIQGRVASQHAVAQQATTAWYFLVPAKLAVSEDFDWMTQPDRLQAAKHYIFHARNDITGLEYGHMATVMYNRDLVLATQGHGLDFTLEQPHEIRPMICGVVDMGDDARTIWRTAFREVVKLSVNQHDIDNQWRLKRWLNCTGESVQHHWTKIGAQDAASFYQEVQGSEDELKKTYEWAWLDQRFNENYV